MREAETRASPAFDSLPFCVETMQVAEDYWRRIVDFSIRLALEEDSRARVLEKMKEKRRLYDMV